METLKSNRTSGGRQPDGIEHESDDDNSSQTMIINKKISFDVAFDSAPGTTGMAARERF